MERITLTKEDEAAALPEGINQLELGLFITEGTRHMDSITTPATCHSRAPARFEPQEIVALIHALCQERGQFVAFNPIILRRRLFEIARQVQAVWDKNERIRRSNSVVRAALSRLGFMHPNQPLQEEPPGGGLASLEASAEGHSPFMEGIRDLLDAELLHVTFKQEDSLVCVLEPTQKMFFA